MRDTHTLLVLHWCAGVYAPVPGTSLCDGALLRYLVRTYERTDCDFVYSRDGYSLHLSIYCVDYNTNNNQPQLHQAT